jgi:hypothetical protein
MTCAIMAPIFPAAALTPWPVLRYLVGKHSPGTMKVVVLGPKLKKSCARIYKASKDPFES